MCLWKSYITRIVAPFPHMLLVIDDVNVSEFDDSLMTAW